MNRALSNHTPPRRRVARRLATALAALATGLACATPAAAQAPAPSGLVMITEVWPPFRMNDERSASGFAGIDIDLTTALAERLGVPIDIRRVPWARALEMMRNGQADLITGIAYTDERAAYMRYAPTSYASVRPMFLARKGQGGQIGSYDDLMGKSIGMSTNSAYFPRFNADAELNKVGLSTELQILQMLAAGRIDLAIGTDPNLSYDLARLGLKDALEPTAWQPDYRTELYVAVSAHSPAAALVGRIDEAIKAMLADGTVEGILRRYR